MQTDFISTFYKFLFNSNLNPIYETFAQVNLLIIYILIGPYQSYVLKKFYSYDFSHFYGKWLHENYWYIINIAGLFGLVLHHVDSSWVIQWQNQSFFKHL